jgi:mannose-6-phosphate isomerase-like protein (cupin superfamily)
VSGLVRHATEAPERRRPGDGAGLREVLDASNGCMPFSLGLLRVAGGAPAVRTSVGADELLFVLSGTGRLIGADGEHRLEPEAGLLVVSGERYELASDGGEDLLIVAVGLHVPLDATAESQERRAAITVSRLRDQNAQAATAEREFRIVFGPDNGCLGATQFVGYIPVGAAPAHYHLYDEVIYVLEGDGVMHMNASQTPLHPGSCIHLPARKLHTLANNGPGIMRVLGVFHPAGSPAAAFYPDGTPATYVAEQPKTASIST